MRVVGIIWKKATRYWFWVNPSTGSALQFWVGGTNTTASEASRNLLGVVPPPTYAIKVLKWGGQNRSDLRQVSSWCSMPKNYFNRLMFHGVIQKITRAQFFFETRRGVFTISTFSLQQHEPVYILHGLMFYLTHSQLHLLVDWFIFSRTFVYID